MRRGDARAYLWAQVRARRAPYWDDSLVIVKATTRRPDTIEPGCVLVQILISVPVAVLHPLEARAVVKLPEAATP